MTSEVYAVDSTTLFVDPGRSQEPHLFGSFVWTSESLTSSSSAAFGIIEAISSFRDCGLPYGLRASLCTLQTVCSVFRLPFHLQHSVRVAGEAFPAGTFTQQEAPSIAWRTNDCTFSCKGRYVMLDNTTAGAARRPSFISKAARPRLVDRRPRVDRPLPVCNGLFDGASTPANPNRVRCTCSQVRQLWAARCLAVGSH